MGACQSRKAATEEGVRAVVATPSKLATALLHRLSSPPQTVTIIPDVDDDFDVEEANLTVASAPRSLSPHVGVPRKGEGPPHAVSVPALLSPLSSVHDDMDDEVDVAVRDDRHRSRSRNQNTPNHRLIQPCLSSEISSNQPEHPANHLVLNSPDMSVYTSSSPTSASPIPASSLLHVRRPLPSETLQPSLPPASPPEPDEESDQDREEQAAEDNNPLTMAKLPLAPALIQEPYPRAAGRKPNLQHRLSPVPPLPRARFQLDPIRNNSPDEDIEPSLDLANVDIVKIQSIATIGPIVTETEIPEEEDPDAPSDEEEYHEKYAEDEEPGRLTIQNIRTKYMASPSSPPLSARLGTGVPPSRASTKLAAMLTATMPPPVMTDEETAAVHPQTLSHFHRMALQQKLHQKQLNKKARAEKIQERIEDVKSYKKLWKDFETMQAKAKETGTKDMPQKTNAEILSSLTPPEKRINPDSHSMPGSATKRNVTIRRSQRGVARSNSFTLGDSSSWYFDFQGTDFAFEGKENLTQSSLSLLSESSLEVQKRLFAQKRISRKHGKREQKNRAQSVGGSLMSTCSSMASNTTGDYGPVRRRRPSYGAMSAPAHSSGYSEVEFTNIEVSFSSPEKARERTGDDASLVSDLADDISASQLREYAAGRRRDYGPVKKSNAETLAQIEQRIRALQRDTMQDPPAENIETHTTAESPSRSERVLATESPLPAALLMDKFQATLTESPNSAVSQDAGKGWGDAQTTPSTKLDRKLEYAAMITPTSIGPSKFHQIKLNDSQSMRKDLAAQDETPRIKNYGDSSIRYQAPLVSPDGSISIQNLDSFEELGRPIETSLLEKSLDESTIALLDDSASITSKQAEPETGNSLSTEPSSRPPLPTKAKTLTAVPPWRAPGSIATMSTEEFLRISEEASVEQQARQVLHAQIKESVTKSRKVTGLDLTMDQSAENPPPVTPEKSTQSSMNEAEQMEMLERLADERMKNRRSLAHMRGFEDPTMAESSLLLAELVEAKVQDVLCKYRGENIS